MSAVDQTQCMRALARANEIRFARADRHREVIGAGEGGRALLADLVESAPPELLRAPVWVLCTWPKRMGAGSAGRLLRSLNIPETRELRQLTSRQRSVLGARLRSDSRPVHFVNGFPLG